MGSNVVGLEVGVDVVGFDVGMDVVGMDVVGTDVGTDAGAWVSVGAGLTPSVGSEGPLVGVLPSIGDEFSVSGIDVVGFLVGAGVGGGGGGDGTKYLSRNSFTQRDRC